MDKLLIPIPSNGVPFNWEDLEFSNGDGVYNGGLIKAIEGQLKQYGDNFVVSGCEVSGSSVSAGWIMLDGELIKVDAHTATDDYYKKSTTYDSDGDKQTQLGTVVQIYQENRATSTASSGNLKNDNRLYGSYTTTSGNITKTKKNETIEILATGITRTVTLDTGYDGEVCSVLMELDSSGTINVVFGSTTVYTVTSYTSTITLSKRFQYINDKWTVLNQEPDASLSNKGIQENATPTEANALAVTNKTITPGTIPISSTSQKGLVEKSTPTEAADGDSDKFIDAELMQTTNGKAWQTPTLNAGYTNGTEPLRYRINRGKLELRGSIYSTGTTGTAFTLPDTGYRPQSNTASCFNVVNFGIGATPAGATINSDGTVYSTNWSTGLENVFNCMVILD